MSPGEIILGILGFVGTVLGIVAVFRKGSGDSIDRKRESEIERLDKRLTQVENDTSLVAAVAWRAVRVIQNLPNAPEFPLSDDELEALERTRPLV